MKNIECRKHLNSLIFGGLALVILLVALFPLSTVFAAGQPTPSVTQTSKPIPTATAQAKKQQDKDNPDLASTIMQTIGNVVNSNGFLSFLTLLAVIAALCISNRQIKENRRLATEERHHQSRPILVPAGWIKEAYVERGNTQTIPFYTEDHNIQWATEMGGQIEIHNMGSGVALNIHCVLYGPEDIHYRQFVSWDNGPIGGDLIHVICGHSQQFKLDQNDLIDGITPLYEHLTVLSSDTSSHRMARLTITYHDLFRNKYVSIFDYTKKDRWICIAINKIPSSKKKPALDLKELNEQRKQSPKLSAPSVQTSP